MVARNGGGSTNFEEDNIDLDADVNADELLQKVIEEKMSTITMNHLTADTDDDVGNGGNVGDMNNNVHNGEEDIDSNSSFTAWSTIELEQFLQGVTKIRPESRLQELQYEISDHTLCAQIARDYVTTRTIEQVKGQYRKYKDNYNAKMFCNTRNPEDPIYRKDVLSKLSKIIERE